MKPTLFFSALAILVLNAASPARAGEWSSGGGDPLETYFEEGRLQAADIVSRLTYTSFPDDAANTQATQWLKKHKDRLAEELREMKFSWKTLSQPKCAWTGYAPFAPVEISFPSCRGTVSSKQEAGKLLIHEAVHHFGVEDHGFATRVAILAYQAWENLLLKEIPFCNEKDTKANILATQLLGSWKYNAEIDAALGGDVPFPIDYDPTQTVWHFKKDLEAVKLFPGIGRCAYLAGWASVTVRKNGQLKHLRSPFVLSEWRGNPTVFIDEDTDADGTDFVTDLHPLFMMIAKGSLPENDIPFQGGDNNNQRLYAFRRLPVSQ
jgi:hypothetical protein